MQNVSFLYSFLLIISNKVNIAVRRTWVTKVALYIDEDDERLTRGVQMNTSD